MAAAFPSDGFLDTLADFCLRARAFAIDESAIASANKVVLDSLGVVLGALDHRAAVCAQRYAQRFPVPQGARVWGTGERVSAEHATLLNGAPLRAYDYNDYYFGKKGGAHPSDMLPGVIAVAEAEGSSGIDAIRALCLGYELVFGLSDYVDPEQVGLDYPVLTTIGAVGAVGSLLALDRRQLRHAFSIAVNSHYPSNEVESSEPDEQGELTMWKRFNGSDGVRQAVQAGYLASVGIEGVVRPFEGKHGFFAKLQVSREDAAAAQRHLDNLRSFSAIGRGGFKRWPVGSRGQSAIQSALRARAALLAAGGSVSDIERITVTADAGVYEHLFAIRSDPYQPISREAADHSLPYIVAIAMVQGQVSPASFEADARALPEVCRLLADRIVIQRAESSSPSNMLAEVLVEDGRGGRFSGGREPAPGSAGQAMPYDSLVEKFKENMGDERRVQSEVLIAHVEGLAHSADVAQLVAATLVK